MDNVDSKTRSRIMRSVKSHNNKSTELKLIQLFKKYNITGWRRKYKLSGKPDFVFPESKIVIFVDGCFWHGCKCKTIPVTNNEYWSNKIANNVKRDIYISNFLRNKGWSVFRFKECKIAKNKLPKYFLNLFK